MLLPIFLSFNKDDAYNDIAGGKLPMNLAYIRYLTYHTDGTSGKMFECAVDGDFKLVVMAAVKSDGSTGALIIMILKLQVDLVQKCIQKFTVVMLEVLVF